MGLVPSEAADNFYDKSYFCRGGSRLSIMRAGGGGYCSMEKYDNPKYYRWKIDIIKKYENGGRVLDVGCAFGYFLKYLGPDFERCGCDLSNFAIENARKIKGASFKVADVSRGIPFGGKFDFVNSFDAMEHIPEIDAVLSNIKNSLKDEGRFYMTVPVNSSFQQGMHRILGLSTLYNDPFHVHFLRPKEWEEKLGSYFEVLEHRPITFERLQLRPLQLWSFFVLQKSF